MTPAADTMRSGASTSITRRGEGELSPRSLSATAQEGREIFLEQSDPPCGACHQLADAGSSGAVGPDLDTLRPSEAQILNAIKRGVGTMPAQDNLSEAQLRALARYVFEATR